MEQETPIWRIANRTGSEVVTYPGQALTREIIAAAMRVHRAVGPGLLETAYQACLCRELQLRHLSFAQQVELSLT